MTATNVIVSPSTNELINPLTSELLEKESTSSETSEMETFEVELVKDKQGLGITIAGYVCEKGNAYYFCTKIID